MFNLGNLITTALLTMGVANATPIYNAKQEEKTPKITTLRNANSSNYTTDYELYLAQTNSSGYRYENVIVQEGYQGYDYENKYNYQATSSYLNVNATTYKTETTRTINNDEKMYFQNYEKIIGNIDYTYENVTQELLVMQITPYNYNVNTNSVITISIDIDGWQDTNGDEIIIKNKYMVSNVYTTIQDDWSAYINRQITSFTAKNIVNDIKDVNNNFYYQKVSNIQELSSQINQILTFDIGIQPNVTTYIAIQLITAVNCEYYDYGNNTYEPFGTQVSTIPLDYNNYNITGIWITGTNVISQGGTYEVIDLPSLMWDILTMPFAFVSQAFNLTLFPNTPYQINIANLFLSLIAVVVFVWLISFFLKMKG